MPKFILEHIVRTQTCAGPPTCPFFSALPTPRSTPPKEPIQCPLPAHLLGHHEQVGCGPQAGEDAVVAELVGGARHLQGRQRQCDVDIGSPCNNIRQRQGEVGASSRRQRQCEIETPLCSLWRLAAACTAAIVLLCKWMACLQRQCPSAGASLWLCRDAPARHGLAWPFLPAAQRSQRRVARRCWQPASCSQPTNPPT